MTSRINFILQADSYKFSQYSVYPENTTGQFSYIEARSKNDTIVPFGLQMWIKKNLLDPITLVDIDEAEEVATLHGDPFNREGWEYILNEYNGYMPLTICGIPEGTITESLTPIVTVMCTDPKVFWLASYIETSLQRGIWYSTSVASNDYQNYKTLKYFYEHGSDNMAMLPYALNDFGSRGVTSEESSQIGGISHLVFFQGTDNMSGIMAGRKYYNTPCAGGSVPASEHSNACAYGKDDQRTYLKRMLDTYAKPGKVVSIVIDGYDVYREANLLCTEFKQQIIDSGAKVVFRPDSGDMFEVVPRLLKMQEDAFGFVINSKGKKVINNVGIIQGDGIDSTTLGMLAQKVNDLGFAPECVVYGSGGGLLQKVNRDTYKFAQKTSAMLINGKWVDTVKDPITDPGKKSKGGLLTDPRMVRYYSVGELHVNDSMEIIRGRANQSMI